MIDSKALLIYNLLLIFHSYIYKSRYISIIFNEQKFQLRPPLSNNSDINTSCALIIEKTIRHFNALLKWMLPRLVTILDQWPLIIYPRFSICYNSQLLPHQRNLLSYFHQPRYSYLKFFERQLLKPLNNLSGSSRHPNHSKILW